MPNARQLLEQADALMRRNRKRGKGKGTGPPTLTDALTNERTGTLAPTIILPEAKSAADSIALGAQSMADPISLDTLSDLPVLTDVVDEWSSQAEVWPPVVPDADATALTEALDDALATASESSSDVGDAAGPADAVATEPQLVEAPAAFETIVRAVDRVADVAPSPVADEPATRSAAAIDEPATRSAEAVDEPATRSAEAVDEPALDTPALRVGAAKPESEPSALPIQDEEFILDIPPMPEPLSAAGTDVAAPAAAVVAAIPQFAPGSPAWEAMAEEIRMQVLQRLDLFTDTGMRDQLGARLQPIVARASAELVETINQALGELVRGYVAEAIEREIESWRKRDG
jgi:hypothetical protein